MTLFEKIIAEYPNIDRELFADGTIILQDDSDGKEAYIAKWSYEHPLPKNLSIGKNG